MSTARLVPETWELSGDDAKRTLTSTDRTRLIKDAIVRLRFADGFSHARSMAYLAILLFVQAVIGAVGIASVLGTGAASSSIVKALRSIVPGAVGRVLTEAVAQAHRAGSSGQWIAVAFGTIGALVTGTTMMGQVERALNRLYGIERDRDTAGKYAHAFVLALAAGALGTLAFVGLGLGGAVAASLGGGTARTIWNLVRWPLGIALLMSATALIFQHAPRRHQPAWSWLSLGAAVAVGLMALVTLALNLFFVFGSTFGTTYGPLAGIVALAFWALLSSISLLMGAALAAQLEAVRAGVAETRRAPGVAEAGTPASALDGRGSMVERVS
jgi:YihY family inner membrane protein